MRTTVTVSADTVENRAKREGGAEGGGQAMSRDTRDSSDILIH